MKRRNKTVSILVLSALALTMALFFLNGTEANAKAEVKRLYGGTRYETAVQASKEGWPDGSKTVVLVSGIDFPDALSAAPLAKKYNSPILLCGTSGVNSVTAAEIERLKPSQMFLIGGESAIPESVEKYYKVSRGIDVKRLGGRDRYETAAIVAEEVIGKDGLKNGIVVASGESFADALSIAPVAASLQMPILLSGKDNASSYTADFINNHGTAKTYVIGGTAAISDNAVGIFGNNVKRLCGSDRYETNIKIIEEFRDKLNFTEIYAASGEDFPDGLVAAPIAALTASPVVIATDSYESYLNTTLDGIRGLDTDRLYILGGSAVVSDSLAAKMAEALNPVFRVVGIE